MTRSYTGDVSLEYGGMYVNLDDSEWKHGYCSAVRVTDLDSGCGFRGAVMVEKVVVYGLESRERKRQALQSCFGSLSEFRETIAHNGTYNQTAYRTALAESLISYGFHDPDDDYVNGHTFIIQCEEDGPMQFDGWKADYRLESDEKLKEHVESLYVNF